MKKILTRLIQYQQLEKEDWLETQFTKKEVMPKHTKIRNTKNIVVPTSQIGGLLRKCTVGGKDPPTYQ